MDDVFLLVGRQKSVFVMRRPCQRRSGESADRYCCTCPIRAFQSRLPGGGLSSNLNIKVTNIKVTKNDELVGVGDGVDVIVEFLIELFLVTLG